MNVFINLPVTDLKRTCDFFSALGFGFNEQFSDRTAACMIINETTFVMLLTHAKFSHFTPRAISDANVATEVMTALTFPSKAEVDQFVDKAISLGASAVRPVEDLGFMYTRAIADLDGHIWEPFWINAEAMRPNP
jgi:hypothetical protein